ncbi:MAG: hypothetical protein RL115_1458, partial [Bacteroidota bacterium]
MAAARVVLNLALTSPCKHIFFFTKKSSVVKGSRQTFNTKMMKR